MMHLLSRDGVPSPGGVWGVPAADIRPLSDARQRVFMARGVFAMRRVSTTAHHQLLLPGEETLLQTRLPTVRAWIIWKILLVSHALRFICLTWFYSTVIKQRKCQIFRFYALTRAIFPFVKLNWMVALMVWFCWTCHHHRLVLQLWRQVHCGIVEELSLYLLGIYASYSHEFSSCVVLFLNWDASVLWFSER